MKAAYLLGKGEANEDLENARVEPAVVWFRRFVACGRAPLELHVRVHTCITSRQL
jgi:hypothetical protein